MARQNKKSFFETFAEKVTKATGSTPVFLGAFSVVIIWAASGPVFDYSETWQLVINTGTTIITFLMVFLIQKSQNKDSLAIQIKLNELLASHELASNRIVDIEDISEEEMEVLEKYYQKLAVLAQKAKSIEESHSLSEAQMRHEMKSVESHKSKAGSPKSEASKTQASKTQASKPQDSKLKTQTKSSKTQVPKAKSQSTGSKSQTTNSKSQGAKSKN
jgi:low affinity Fe/Cu permease